MKVSIITVTYNCKDDLIKTIESVKNQTYKGIEHIIIDGNSNDGTCKVIEEYYLNNKNVKYISEEDNGIYDAMNKGIGLSNGEVIFFLNARDTFCDSKVIENVVNKFVLNDVDIFYGDVILGNNSKIIRHDHKLKKQIKMKGICHQAVFFNKRCFQAIGNFNIFYKISADYDFIVRAYISKLTFFYFPINVAYFDETGISSNVSNWVIAIKEYKSIIDSNFKGINRILPSIRWVYMMLKLYVKKGKKHD